MTRTMDLLEKGKIEEVLKTRKILQQVQRHNDPGAGSGSGVLAHKLSGDEECDGTRTGGEDQIEDADGKDDSPAED